MPSPLVRFYRHQGPDHLGRMLAEIWHWSHDALEVHHDYIQWLFPLRTPSSANRHAPLLTDDDIGHWLDDPMLRMNLRRSFEVMLQFYGLRLTHAEGTLNVVLASNAAERQLHWSPRATTTTSASPASCSPRTPRRTRTWSPPRCARRCDGSRPRIMRRSMRRRWGFGRRADDREPRMIDDREARSEKREAWAGAALGGVGSDAPQPRMSRGAGEAGVKTRRAALGFARTDTPGRAPQRAKSRPIHDHARPFTSFRAGSPLRSG